MANQKLTRKEFLKRLGITSLGLALAGTFLGSYAETVFAGVSDNMASGSGGGVKVSATPPANPHMLWINTSKANFPYYHNGVAWVPVPTVYESGENPGNDSQIPWLQKSTGVVYYNNGTQWVNTRSVWGQTTR